LSYVVNSASLFFWKISLFFPKKQGVNLQPHAASRGVLALKVCRLASTEPTMIFRTSRILRFWVDVEYEDIENQGPSRAKSELIAQILRAYEEAGDAMRHLNTKGEIAWKATPRMLTRLADAEREASDDLADWP
jgi:hypothetical protein